VEQISKNKLYLKYYALVLQKDVTSYEVSKQTGIALSTLSAWKSDKYTPKMDKLAKIAAYFGVPVDYFIGTGGDS
jgi:repressor LexA